MRWHLRPLLCARWQVYYYYSETIRGSLWKIRSLSVIDSVWREKKKTAQNLKVIITPQGYYWQQPRKDSSNVSRQSWATSLLALFSCALAHKCCACAEETSREHWPEIMFTKFNRVFSDTLLRNVHQKSIMWFNWRTWFFETMRPWKNIPK